MAIYTKKGDKGETKVFNKKSGQLVGVSKMSCQIKSIGTIDELNSFLAIVIAEIRSQKLEISKYRYEKQIREVQNNLFIINSILAGSSLKFSITKVKKLEKDLDDWEGSLPVLKNFIYYGGSEISSLLFYARALCRKAERSLVRYFHQEPTTNYQLLAYVNRLSDYLFMLARKVNYDLKVKEEYWIGNKRK